MRLLRLLSINSEAGSTEECSQSIEVVNDVVIIIIIIIGTGIVVDRHIPFYLLSISAYLIFLSSIAVERRDDKEEYCCSSFTFLILLVTKELLISLVNFWGTAKH